MNRIDALGGALVASAMVLFTAGAGAQTPLGTAFTYQGELRQNNVVVDQASDFVFDVYGQAAGGAALGTNARNAVPVVRGVFSVELDYGAGVFAGDERWLEIRVRTPAGGGAFTALSPRVRLTPAPHAQFALQSAQAKNSALLGNNAASAFVLKGEVDSVTAAMIAAGAVGSSELANDTVTSAKIAPGAVTNADLAANSVASVNVVDGSITAADLAPGAIDGGNATTLDGFDGLQFLRSDVNDTINGSVWTISAGSPNEFTIGGTNLELSLGDSTADQVSVNGVFSTNSAVTLGDAITDLTTASGNLNVVGQLTIGNVFTFDQSGPKRLRFENGSGGLETNFSYEPALGAFDTVSSLKLGNGTIWAGGSGGLISLPAFNAFGSSKFPEADEVSDRDDVFVTDDLAVGDALIIGTNPALNADSTIYFTDPGFSADLNVASHANSIGWVEATGSTLSACPAPVGAISSAMVFNVGDGSASGWAFTNGTDVEFVVDETGVVGADSTINASGGCDLAECFLGPDGLAPGTLLRVDPATPEAVLPTTAAYDPTVVGVVSASPALVMGGPTAGALPVIEDMKESYRLLELNPNDAALQQRAQDLEHAVDTWQRGNVEVALVGRVPVKVVGPVSVGDPLASSDVEGHAMAMTNAGPSIGIALESKASAGPGTVMVLLQPGHRSPLAHAAGPEREAAAPDVDALLNTLEERILVRLEGRAVSADAGRDGGDAQDAADGARGESGARGADGAVVRGLAVVRLEKEAWGDFDRDGKDDVLVLNPGAPAKLYQNLGDGRFQDVSASASLGDTKAVATALWQDADADDRLDLLLVGVDGEARFLRGNGAGQFTDVTQSLGIDFGKPIVEAEWIDHDHDGRPDLRVALGDGTLLLHHNLGGLTFETVALRPASPANLGVGARVAQLEARLAEMEARLAAMLSAPGANR